MDSKKKPELTDEEIGMRTFQLRKAQAVERAMDRVRRGLGDDWALLSQRDLDDMEWILGEVWAYLTRADWDDLHFSKLTLEDVQEIIALSRALQDESRNTVETIQQVAEIIRSRSV